MKRCITCGKFSRRHIGIECEHCCSPADLARANDKRRNQPRTENQYNATQRNFAIRRLRLMHSLTQMQIHYKCGNSRGVFSTRQIKCLQFIIDLALKRLGAETKHERIDRLMLEPEERKIKS